MVQDATPITGNITLLVLEYDLFIWKSTHVCNNIADYIFLFYSTKSMREDGGYELIKKAILNLSLRHNEHISAYGEGNERRLTGLHETASINTFSWVCSENILSNYKELKEQWRNKIFFAKYC